jgi:hypothetical protein
MNEEQRHSPPQWSNVQTSVGTPIACQARALLNENNGEARAISGFVNRLSDNVGGVKHFLSVLLRALRRARHFALVEKQLPVPTKGSLAINSGQISIRPMHLFGHLLRS